LGDGAHLDRHLADWARVFGDVRSVEDVSTIAKSLFYETRQYEWVNKGGTWAVHKHYRGRRVRLVWGLGGIVSCFPVESPPPAAAPAGSFTSPPPSGAPSPAPAPAQPGAYSSPPPSGYTFPPSSAHRPASAASSAPAGYASPGGAHTAPGSSAAPAPVTVLDPRAVLALGEGQVVVYAGYAWTRHNGQLLWYDPAPTPSWRNRFEDRDWLFPV
jgi:hypothetical protein